MTFLPRYNGKVIEDTLLILIFVEIKVKFPTKYPNNVSYKYVVRLQDEDNIKRSFSEFPWYGDLIEQVKRFQNLVGKNGCQLEVYEKQLHSYWRPIHPNKMQEDILQKSFVAQQFGRIFHLHFTTDYGKKVML